MNALSLLRTQHREAERLFARLDRATDPADQRLLVDELVDHLAAHMAAEEAVMYPVAYGSRAQALLVDALEEHRETSRLVAALVGCAPGHRHFRATLRALEREFEQHIAEEEDLFEVLESRLGEALLEKLGRELSTAYAREVQEAPPAFRALERTSTV